MYDRSLAALGRGSCSYNSECLFELKGFRHVVLQSTSFTTLKYDQAHFFLFLHCYFKRHAQACNSGINFTVGNITLAKHLIPTSTNRVSKIAMCRKTEKKTFNLLEFYFIVISNFKSDEHEKIFLLYKGLFPAADNDPKQTSILARWWVW